MNPRLKRVVPSALVLGCLSGLVSAQAPDGRSSALQPSATAPRRVEVLFVGQRARDRDTDRFVANAKAALSQYGFNFSYTTSLADLNGATLSQYDALVVTGVNDTPTAAEGQALVDFVASGHGLVAVDGAGTAIQRSTAYASLVRGTVERRGTGTVMPSAASSHPILEGLGTSGGAGNMEGKEVRFGIAGSALYAASTTAASCGAVNAMHDSFTPLGGLVALFNMQLGEVVFGGVGAGLYFGREVWWARARDDHKRRA